VFDDNDDKQKTDRSQQYRANERTFLLYHVAVKEKRQIDSDYDLERLVKRLNLYNYDKSIAIEYVCKQSTSYD
jgi:hypothetical protein